MSRKLSLAQPALRHDADAAPFASRSIAIAVPIDDTSR